MEKYMSKPVSLVMLVICTISLFAQKDSQTSATTTSGPEVSVAINGVSQPVMHMHESAAPGVLSEKPLRLLHPDNPVTGLDTAVQSGPIPASTSASPGLNFLGLGVGFPGFTPNAAPPDPNGAVGATQFVEWVNESFAVFDKSSGALLKGPVDGNQLFQALGPSHPCAVNNDGDPIAQYDKANGRWILTQFSITNGGSEGFWQCVAVSKTNDATGAFNVYAFQQPNFNDYPKLGVWNTGYFVPFNIFTNTFQD